MRLRKALVSALTIANMAIVATALPAAAEDDILTQLKRVDGLTVISESPTPPAGYRFFILSYEQHADHRDPRSRTFEQRLQLLHKSTDRPMVLHTTGYTMRETAFRSEPTQLVDGNQISVEQRFFTPSRPAPADWDDLDIWQAATDHHRIAQALHDVYRRQWISTGSSKGGMTSVYHRRFYPGDVSGVVAYVAPNDADNKEDSAYSQFFTTVGDDPACRQALRAVERQGLLRRTEILAKFETEAARNGWTFTLIGSADRALEAVVANTAWAFWQYHTQAECSTVPAPTAPTDELYAFVDGIIGFSSYADQGLERYIPYYYQSASQLGWPSYDTPHLDDLLRYPDLEGPNSQLPPELRRKHDPFPMRDVDAWVRTQSSQMLFVYGANDPYGSERFVPSAQDSYLYTAVGGNHLSTIARLTTGDRDAAIQAVRRWAGVGGMPAARPDAALDTVDKVTLGR